MTKKSSRRVRGGALFVLAACFVVSALIRAGEVVAALPQTLDDGFGNPIAPVKTDKSKQQAAGGTVKEIGPPELLSEVRRQRERLKKRAATLDAREQKLKSIEKRLESRIEELRAARDRLANTAALVDDAAGKDVRRLADMYQQMKPKQAGQIFNQMAPSFAAGFIAEMRPDAAALIMANMDADKAYAVSLMLAGRNMNRDGQTR